MNLININSIKYENYFNHSLLDFSNFVLQASITQDEKLVFSPWVFSTSTALSICWISSWGNLIPLVVDLLFLCPVAIVIPSINCLYTLAEITSKKKLDVHKHLNYYNWCMNTCFIALKKQTPKDAGTFLSVLTNNLTKDKTMANLNYTGFTYIFIGILRTDLSNRLHKLRIPAESKLQARKKLARDYVLVFAGKIPLKTHRTFTPDALEVDHA